MTILRRISIPLTADFVLDKVLGVYQGVAAIITISSSCRYVERDPRARNDATKSTRSGVVRMHP